MPSSRRSSAARGATAASRSDRVSGSRFLIRAFAEWTGSPTRGQARLDHPLAAQALVRLDRHRRDSPRLVGRGGAGNLLVTGRQQRVEGLVGGSISKPVRLGGVEYAESGDRARPPADGQRAAGDRRHGSSSPRRARSPARRPCSSPARSASPPARAARAREPSSCADPGAHLGRGALGEGEGEDPLDLDPVVGDRGAVALDQDRRLPGARPGFEEGVAAARGDRVPPARRSAPPAARAPSRTRSRPGRAAPAQRRR